MQSIPESSELFNLVNTDKLNNFADVEIKQEDVTPIYDVNGVWDDYLLALNKKQRHEIRRKLRKFESQDFQFKLIRNNDDLSVFLSDFYELFINSREDKKEFLTEERKTFFNKMLFAFAEKNELKILSYYDGNTLISACIVIEYANIYFLYNSAYSLDYNSYSVGLVSKIIALKQSIENNNHAFNFLRGNERYKYELGGEDIKLHEIKLLVN
jgi:predicted N-acyltransferase